MFKQHHELTNIYVRVYVCVYVYIYIDIQIYTQITAIASLTVCYEELLVSEVFSLSTDIFLIKNK